MAMERQQDSGQEQKLPIEKLGPRVEDLINKFTDALLDNTPEFVEASSIAYFASFQNDPEKMVQFIRNNNLYKVSYDVNSDQFTWGRYFKIAIEDYSNSNNEHFMKLHMFTIFNLQNEIIYAGIESSKGMPEEHKEANNETAIKHALELLKHFEQTPQAPIETPALPNKQ